jgi:hypothetical protein
MGYGIKVTKFESRNLRGENRAEEKRRILYERVEGIRQGLSPKEVRKIGGKRAGIFGFKY